jgi:hypothetical protein
LKKIIHDSILIDPVNNTIDTLTTVIDPVIRQKAAYNGRFFFDIPANRWRFAGSVNYFRLQHSLERIGDTFIHDSILQEKVYENITYNDVAVQFTATEAFRIGAGMWIKNDFENVPFDYGNFSLSVNGDPSVKFNPRQSFYLSYDCIGYYRFGRAYNDKTDAMGFGCSVYLRPVVKFSKTFFFKGVIILDAANEILKQWYEVTFRKAWSSNSFIEARYFGSYGVLFPRHGLRLNGSFFLGKFGIHPEVEGILRYSADGSVQTHRLAPGLEISLRPFKWTEFYLGGDVYFFNEYRPFTDRGIAFLGIRGW